MSLRARDQKVFFVVCDRCERQSAADLMPVGAEARAAAAGFIADTNPLRHACPRCADAPATPTTGR